MAGAIILLVIVTLVVGVTINVYLRAWVQEEGRREAHMRDPRTHTVAYAAPSGVDPAVIRIELAHAGFTTGFDHVGYLECLRIECEPTQRERVRSLIEGVHMSRYDDSALKVEPVAFEYER